MDLSDGATPLRPAGEVERQDQHAQDTAAENTEPRVCFLPLLQLVALGHFFVAHCLEHFETATVCL